MGINATLEAPWSLAVAHRISNADFRLPCYGYRVQFVSAVYSAGTDSTTITFTNISGTPAVDGSNLIPSYKSSGGADLYGRMPMGCMIVSTSSGAREEKQVKSAAGSSIIVFGQLANTYASGDIITVASTSIPSGWSQFGFVGVTGSMYQSGYLNRSGLRISTPVVTNAIGGLSQNIQNLISNTTYRLSVYFKLAALLASPVEVKVFADSVQIGSQLLQTASIGGNWEETASTFFVGHDDVECTISIEKPAGLSIPISNSLYIGGVCLQHVRGLGTPYEADALYELPIAPSRYSHSSRVVRAPLDLESGYSVQFQQRRNVLNQRVSVRATFEEVPEEMMNNVLALKSWQERGHAIVLRTPYRELKPWTVGYMQVSFSQRVTNLSKPSMDFRFTEL